MIWISIFHKILNFSQVQSEVQICDGDDAAMSQVLENTKKIFEIGCNDRGKHQFPFKDPFFLSNLQQNDQKFKLKNYAYPFLK